MVGWKCGTYGTPDDSKYPSQPRYMPTHTRSPVFRVYSSCLQTFCKMRSATLQRVAKPVPRQDSNTTTKKGTHARSRCPVGSSKPRSQRSGSVRQYTAKAVATFFSVSLLIPCGPGSSVGIATGYSLNGPGIESRWGRDFPRLSRPALGPT